MYRSTVTICVGAETPKKLFWAIRTLIRTAGIFPPTGRFMTRSWRLLRPAIPTVSDYVSRMAAVALWAAVVDRPMTPSWHSQKAQCAAQYASPNKVRSSPLAMAQQPLHA